MKLISPKSYYYSRHTSEAMQQKHKIHLFFFISVVDVIQNEKQTQTYAFIQKKNKRNWALFATLPMFEKQKK